jgi:hypothetical protein
LSLRDGAQLACGGPCRAICTDCAFGCSARHTATPDNPRAMLQSRVHIMQAPLKKSLPALRKIDCERSFCSRHATAQSKHQHHVVQSTQQI